MKQSVLSQPSRPPRKKNWQPCIEMKVNRQTLIRPLISTRLQPGVGGRLVSSAASAASRARGKAAKAARCSFVRSVTGLKPGANERSQNREVDFLVCYKGKWGILEGDGEAFHPAS